MLCLLVYLYKQYLKVSKDKEKFTQFMA